MARAKESDRSILTASRGSSLTTLIAELEKLQAREGWLSNEALRNLAEVLAVPLHRLESLASFYTHFRRSPPRRWQLNVCRDLSCQLAGATEHLARLRERAGSTPDLEIREVSCLGRCDGAPAAAEGERVFRLDDPDLLERIESTNPVPRLESRTDRWLEARVYRSPEERWGTLRRQLEQTPGALRQTLETADLRGMGGGGFPTARKWALVAQQAAGPRTVICNADESEPGAFKDREILRDLPHLVIEGMALAAYEIGAQRGWIFLRNEYRAERRCIAAALEEARAYGALGTSIFGSNFNFELEIFDSPGGYILGEETALLECMEDRRGEPRNKPPLPGEVGLHGQPTLINNVETFAHATAIAAHGADWWHGLGREGFRGHKFVSVSGDVKTPGVSLVPFGTSLGELLERHGGMRDSRSLAVVAPGGASSTFLGPESLDLPIDFESLAQAGSMLGAGSVVFIAEGRDLLEAGLNITRFFRNESCGKCVPCRTGIEKALEHMKEHDATTPESRELLERIHATLARTSLCGLGHVALAPLLSLLDHLPAKGPRPGST